jgi:hypothetical protein
MSDVVRHIAFRAVTLACSAILGLQALWLLTVEFVRPKISYLPATKAELSAAVTHSVSAGIAAKIGVLRGDVYAEYAITRRADFLLDIEGSKGAASHRAIEEARAAASHAAALAPSDPRTWLLLAEVASHDSSPQEISEILKMSYYTGPNAVALMPERLTLAVHTAAIKDPDLQDLVSREIQTIVTRRPDLRPALFKAYSEASPEGRDFIDSRIGKLDQNLYLAMHGATEQSLERNGQPTTAPQTSEPALPPPSPQVSSPPIAVTSSSPRSDLSAREPSPDQATDLVPLPRPRPPRPLQNAKPLSPAVETDSR